jgi:hypothetical protein
MHGPAAGCCEADPLSRELWKFLYIAEAHARAAPSSAQRSVVYCRAGRVHEELRGTKKSGSMRSLRSYASYETLG